MSQKLLAKPWLHEFWVLLQNYSRYLSSVTAGQENQFQVFEPSFKLTNQCKYMRIYQVKFVEDSFSNIWRDMVCLSRLYPLKVFKGYLLQILLGPFLKTFTQIIVWMVTWCFHSLLWRHTDCRGENSVVLLVVLL